MHIFLKHPQIWYWQLLLNINYSILMTRQINISETSFLRYFGHNYKAI
jgi:hypothetical protein